VRDWIVGAVVPIANVLVCEIVVGWFLVSVIPRWVSKEVDGEKRERESD
jgi:hypothetical protein